jgi:hypothetical protein
MSCRRASSAAADDDNNDDDRAKLSGLVTTLDLAMNEPTAAEVRKLVAEQRVMQEQLKALLQRVGVRACGVCVRAR